MRDEWQRARLSEHVEIAIGGTPSRAMPRFWAEKPAGHPWLAISDLREKYVSDTREHITDLGVRSSNVKLIPARSTVMSFKLSVGRVAITTCPMYSNEAIAAFVPRSDAVHPGWLYHVLPRAAGTVVTDSAVKGATLNKAKLAEMTALLPSPEEQRFIARVLDTLDTTIRQTEAIIEKLKQVKQGLLHDLLTRGIDDNGELRPPQSRAPHLYKDSPLGWIPESWNVLSVEEMVTAPICYGIVQVLSFVPYGVPVLAIKDLLGDYLSGVHRTAKSIDEAYSRSRVKPGDVLVSIKGTIGRVGVVPDHYAGNISRDIARLRPGPVIRPNFFGQLLRSQIGQTILAQAQVGTTRAELSIAPLRRLRFAIPDPCDQALIEAALSLQDRRLLAEVATLSKLRSAKSGLMDDLLAGRVRVTPLLASLDV